MDIVLFESNNSVNQGFNSLVIISRQFYLLRSSLCKTPSKSVDFVTKMIICYLNHVIPLVCVLAPHLRWSVCCGCIFSINPSIATGHVCISTFTASFILVSLWIHKTHGSLCKQIFIFSCDPNCTSFPLLVEFLCDLLIYGAFPIIDLLHITHYPTGKNLSFFIGK